MQALVAHALTPVQPKGCNKSSVGSSLLSFSSLSSLDYMTAKTDELEGQARRSEGESETRTDESNNTINEERASYGNWKWCNASVTGDRVQQILSGVGIIVERLDHGDKTPSWSDTPDEVREKLKHLLMNARKQ